MDYAQTTFKDKVNDGTIPYASNVDVIFVREVNAWINTCATLQK